MGLGPLAVKTNDMICVLKGCNVPVVIREEHGYHLFVGECFVWGLMNGETVKNGMGNGRVFHTLSTSQSPNQTHVTRAAFAQASLLSNLLSQVQVEYNK